ncbi:hypothetical protein BJ912DRAFT_1040091 [Pholiota molesta]|nr:hypothetical protein BJ912DRAFT_1040091 [Pholiota molesta]
MSILCDVVVHRRCNITAPQLVPLAGANATWTLDGSAIVAWNVLCSKCRRGTRPQPGDGGRLFSQENRICNGAPSLPEQRSGYWWNVCNGFSVATMYDLSGVRASLRPGVLACGIFSLNVPCDELQRNERLFIVFKGGIGIEQCLSLQVLAVIAVHIDRVNDLPILWR